MKTALGTGLALTLALLLAHSAEYLFLTDDAFISFRYARNLAEGHGLVFNPGFERVEGYTNFLWVLLLAVFGYLGVEPETTSHWLSLCLTVLLWGLVVWFARRNTRPPSPAWLVLVPPLLLASTRSIAVWATGGLETRLFEVLVVGGCLRLIVEAEAGLSGAVPRTPLSGVLLGLSALTRPDGLLIGACAFATMLLTLTVPRRLPWRSLLPQAAVFCLIAVAHLAFRLLYYGDWLPNTYYAKVGGRTWWSMGAAYAAMFAVEYAAFLWLPLLAAAVLRHRRSGTGYVPALFAAVVLPHLLYVISIGGDHFEYRPLDLYFPFVFLLLRDGAEHLSRTTLRAGGALCCLAAVLAGLVLLPCQTHALYPEDRYRFGAPGGWAQQAEQPDLFRNEPLLGLPDLPGLRWLVESYLALLRQTTGSFVGVRAEDHAGFLASVASEGVALRRQVEEGALPEDTHIAVDSVGAIPYYSRLRTLDRRGLTDRQVARSGSTGEGLLAHDRQASFGYAASRGVDLWALDHVHLLWRSTDPDFVSLLRLAHLDRSPAYLAKAGEDRYLLALLPRGLADARARFPKLSFRPVRDPAALPAGSSLP